MKKYWLAFLLFAPLLSGAGPTDAAQVRILFDSWAGPSLRVFITRPAGLAADRPVVFVMHGVQRNAEEYRNQWHELALQYDFLLVVPEFTQQDFPGAEGYNFGNVFDESGAAVPEAYWSFSAIEPLFDDIRRRYSLTAPGYALYGHSAGAQFVHRFLFHVPEARVTQIVAANAGWYTMPDFDIGFPYGLNDSAVGREQLARALQLPVTILLGDRDTDAAHPSLRRTPEALAQGGDRFARGFSFFDAARAAADQLGVPFEWHLSTVRGAGHDNRLMAPAAVAYLLADDARPGDATH